MATLHCFISHKLTGGGSWRAQTRSPFVLWLTIATLLLVLQAKVDCKIFSATMSWQRIGATPQFLSAGADSQTSCGSSFNADPAAGCTFPNYRTFLFTVEAVFESTAFDSLPIVGSEIKTSSPCEFCSGEAGEACYPAFLEVVSIVPNATLRSAVTLIYTQFQKLKVYSNRQDSNATALFKTVVQYPQCGTSASTICLSPDNTGFCASAGCLSDVAEQLLNLSATVLFHDTADSNPWDTTLYPTYRIFPATNHHSPFTTYLPIVTVPMLLNVSMSFELQIAAVDEDGASEPLNCAGSTPCSNVAFGWGIKTQRSSDGLTLNFHSDGTQTPNGGGWVLGGRDNRVGGGVTLSLVGPMIQPVSTTVNSFYPVRILFSDAMKYQASLDFVIQICKTLTPVKITQSTLSLIYFAGLPIAPIFIASNSSGHYPAPTRIQCYAGSPCTFNVSVAVYNTSQVSQLARQGYCRWGSSSSSNQTVQCIDNVQRLNSTSSVLIDSTHTKSRTCGGFLYPGSGTGIASSLNTPKCHNVSQQTIINNTAQLSVDVFGLRPTYTKPYEFDIGRKLILCFQARACATCCYSAPYCVTVEIIGHTPNIELPAVPPTCTISNFSSDKLTATGLIEPATLPPVSQYSSTCPHLYACWILDSAAADPSPSSPPPPGLPSQYSQRTAPSRFLLQAADADGGELLRIDVLWGPTYDVSTIWLAGSNLSTTTEATYHGGACFGSPWSSDPACQNGTRVLNVTTYYALPPPAPPQFSPVRTANVPFLNPFPPPWGGINEDGYYHVRFEADKTVCFTATDNQAAKWGRGLNNTQARCHVLRFRGPPVFVGHRSRPLDSPFAFLDSNNMWAGIKTLHGLIGAPINFTMRARDPNPEDTVNIYVLQEPGVPPGVEVGPNQCVFHGSETSNTVPQGNVTSACAEAFRTVAWTPRAGDEGRLYRICFVARDDKPYCAIPNPAVLSQIGPRATTRGYYGLTHCVDINVSFAEPAWIDNATEAPAGAAGMDKRVYVGCENVSPAAAADPYYVTEIVFAGGSDIPLGMRLSPISAGTAVRTDVRWTPQGAYGAPRLPSGAAALPPRCVTYRVQRCKYCVASAETLLSKVKAFSPDINWMLLWAANGNDDYDGNTSPVYDPDLLLAFGTQQVVNIGPVYRAKAGDTLYSMAARFRTTVKSLLGLNPDLDPARPFRAGQPICVTLCVT